MKRFYAAVAVGDAANGHAVLLDGRPVRTPARQQLILPVAALAAAVAAEWDAQGETIDADSMRLTRLATTTVDLMPARRQDAIDEAAQALLGQLRSTANQPQADAPAAARLPHTGHVS